MILEGGGRMALDDEIIEVREYDAIRVPPETVRAFEGAGPGGSDTRDRGRRRSAPRATPSRSRTGGRSEPGLS